MITHILTVLRHKNVFTCQLHYNKPCTACQDALVAWNSNNWNIWLECFVFNTWFPLQMHHVLSIVLPISTNDVQKWHTPGNTCASTLTFSGVSVSSSNETHPRPLRHNLFHGSGPSFKNPLQQAKEAIKIYKALGQFSKHLLWSLKLGRTSTAAPLSTPRGWLWCGSAVGDCTWRCERFRWKQQFSSGTARPFHIYAVSSGTKQAVAAIQPNPQLCVLATGRLPWPMGPIPWSFPFDPSLAFPKSWRYLGPNGRPGPTDPRPSRANTRAAARLGPSPDLARIHLRPDRDRATSASAGLPSSNLSVALSRRGPPGRRHPTG